MDSAELRKAILEEIAELSPMEGSVQMTPVLKEVAKRFDIKGDEAEQMILTAWYDLFRNGHLSWGLNLGQPGLPFIHLTERGRETFLYLSRDPANPDGYLGHLNQSASLTPIAKSYIAEALETYNSNCFKATAVMVGGAAESIILDVRDILVNGMNNVGRTVPRKLQDWRIKTVLDAMETELETHKSDMPRKLEENFAAYWSAFTAQIRTVRNDAGHPKSVEPVTPEAVHASLLIFPELAKLAAEIIDWANTFYV